MQVSKAILSVIILFSVPSFAEYYEHPQNLYNKSLEAYEKNDFGYAMFYAKQARALDPSNKNIRTLFFKIRQDIGLPTIFSEEQFSSKIITFIFQSFPPHLNAFVAGVLFILGAGIISLLLLKQIKIPIFVPIIVCSVSIFLMIQAIIQYQLFQTDERVILKTTSLYEEPSTNSTKLQELPAGTEIKVIAKTDDFLLVQLLNSTEAWVLTNEIPPLF
ncbi:MAG: SH3 domain-containing protein [Brevinema sp.]